MVTKIIWSNEAKSELKEIYNNLLDYTKSKRNSLNVIDDIVTTVEETKYPEQYQVDEIMGEPYRRIVVRNFKITYRIMNDNTIRIIGITFTYKNPIG